MNLNNKALYQFLSDIGELANSFRFHISIDNYISRADVDEMET